MGEMEKSGVPAVGLVAQPFERDFLASAKIFGVPDVSYLIVSERALPTMQHSEIIGRAEAVVDGVVEKLTTRTEAQRSEQGVASLAKILLKQDVPETEVFEASDRL